MYGFTVRDCEVWAVGWGAGLALGNWLFIYWYGNANGLV